MNARRRAGLVAVGHVAIVGLVAACTGHGAKPLPNLPPVTTAAPTTTIDLTAINLGSVAGQTTVPTISLTPGNATIAGTVTDDTGAPVPGAIVNIQRVVGAATASGDFAATAAGTFSVPGLLGGDYRVRAWRAPDLAVTTPVVFYVSATDTQTVNLQLQRFTGLQVTYSIAPNPPIITEPAQIAVEVAATMVGPDGVVSGKGQPGQSVQLFGNGAWTIDGNPTESTDTNGIARWRVTCQQLGSQQLAVLVNGNQEQPLNIAGCVPIPTTTTQAPASTTTTAPGQTTTTVRRRGSTTTLP